MERSPNLLIIGAEKSGTTTLASSLNQHLEIFIPQQKELMYFTHHYDEWTSVDYSQFYLERTEKYLCDASPSYAWYPIFKNVPEMIYDKLGPNVKFIYIVRDPFERLKSHYIHAIHHNWLKNKTPINEAVKQCPQLLYCSEYYVQLQQYLNTFDINQILVITMEELRSDHQKVMDKIFRFLNISSAVIDIKVRNSSGDKLYLPKFLNDLRYNSLLRKRWSSEKITEVLYRYFGKKIVIQDLDQLEVQYIERINHDIVLFNELLNTKYYDTKKI